MTIRAELDIIRITARDAGIDLPDALADAFADRERINTALAKFAPPDPADIADLMAAALLAGNDPFDDDEVRRYATYSALTADGDGSIAGPTSAAIDRRCRHAAIECADELIDAMKEVADSAGATLTDAYGLLGDVDLDAGSLPIKGVDAAAAWLDAKAAAKTVGAIGAAWQLLAKLTRRTSADVSRVLVLADAPLDVFEPLRRRSTVWEIINHGDTIDLATFDSIGERVRRINNERTERDEALEQASIEAFGAHRRFRPARTSTAS